MDQDWKKSPKWSLLEYRIKVCYLQSACFKVLFFILLRDRLKSTLKLENSLIQMRNYFKIIILQTVFSPNPETKFRRNFLIFCLFFCLSGLFNWMFDQNAWTLRPICLKFCFENSWEPNALSLVLLSGLPLGFPQNTQFRGSAWNDFFAWNSASFAYQYETSFAQNLTWIRNLSQIFFMIFAWILVIFACNFEMHLKTKTWKLCTWKRN